MFFTAPNWAAKRREDRRPLYRRIFTNRRLDIAHKSKPFALFHYFNVLAFVRSILGFILFSTSYCLVNTGIYYKYVRPLRQEEREQLERELIEADKAGFKVNLK